ncbi:MAG: beta galactosidase jelly roll domain-containing protein [Sphingomonadaceae bacterium]|nr:beta galactosidase jelly roll domain-containing protein [Sphingomonadaceae bacterium]
MIVGVALASSALPSPSAGVPTFPVPPNNVDFPVGGGGFSRDLSAPVTVSADADWTLAGWIKLTATDGAALIGGIAGDAAGAPGEYLVAGPHMVGIWNGRTLRQAPARLGNSWHVLTAVAHAGTVAIAVDRRVVLRAPTVAFSGSRLDLGPRHLGGFAPFGGKVAGFGFAARALTGAELATLAAAVPDERLIRFDTGSPEWPVQVTNMVGLTAPQDPASLPRAAAPPSTPVATPAYAGPSLVAVGTRRWTLPKWTLISASDAGEDGARLSQPGFVGGIPATVAGTVLTTLVDRGIYPDPAYGLNNMAIPDSIGRQDWWYRSTFDAPADHPEHLRLTFDGINYSAEVWLNGTQLGGVRGAFIRGSFDVSAALKPRDNVLAVRIHPPIHPGTPHEQSILAGWGPNGGLQALDGPTFFATEGWDWIPGVRDRNIGLWQPVELTGSGLVRLGDPQIVTTLPKADNSVADIEIDVPVVNDGSAAVMATVAVGFDDVSVTRTVTAAPGQTMVRFAPLDFPQLAVANPKLWWPNGYGAPALHLAHVTVATAGGESDATDVRFGIRQITYELSLMAPDGRLRRVEVDFSAGRRRGEQLLDPRHQGIRKIPGGWVNSLTPAGAASPAVRDLADTRLTPFLILKVNGVRIAARGGSWGMDDFMKRSSRERLEPFFRLHRDANVNIIRNWVGQNTEPVFYDLADEYGMLVTNDFWASTQDFQMEPEDPDLFLANAEDTIRRYRNHPSIALWFGRNEGVPPRLINEGLERLTRTLDGTRWYTGSSNSVNLWVSGPYDYREPATYFTDHAKGFAVEVGSQSFPTLEAFEAMVPAADRWPISDTWAYHDWHQNGNGDTHKFMAAMTAHLGAPSDLNDFERKAQLMNYDTFRAIMEGMNAGLWSTTSGRMLWMTQSAWPSTMWQIISHDTDTAAPFYAFKNAAEPVHVQLTLPDHRLQIVNNRQVPVAATTCVSVTTLANIPRMRQCTAATVAPGQVHDLGDGAALTAQLAVDHALIVALDARDAAGALLSHNLYWLAADDAGWRAIAAMAPQPVTLAVTRGADGGGDGHVAVTLANTGAAPALEAKLTLLDAAGARILPAYYSDNYVSLLPGERRTIDVAFPAGKRPAAIALRGWNVVPGRTEVSR